MSKKGRESKREGERKSKRERIAKKKKNTDTTAYV